MNADELLHVLEYDRASGFVPRARLAESVDQAHVFRRAINACHLGGGELHGVYQLQQSQDAGGATSVVYVAEASSVDEADKLHRLIWNQAAVPFVLVRLPTGVRLYSGFRYASKPRSGKVRGPREGVLAASVAFGKVLDELADFRAGAIENGDLWRARAADVDSSERVDWKLLENLAGLGATLRAQGLKAEVAHALIGKFVFLRYLADRGILSARRLEELDVPADVLGRKMTTEGLRRLVSRVDAWLNGGIFPLSFTGRDAPTTEQLRYVAGVFLGDTSGGQLHLAFDAYDFSYIPIETLSVIYEQFLAAEQRDRQAGAFYTPIPVVNFMLAELDDLTPLPAGGRVFDPACGSGAFLVQCYRRMVERQARQAKRTLRPVELRDILVRRVFGIDRDAEACRVSELSLLLTMLDYIEPPDLVSNPTFKLPTLAQKNIFQGDFFEDGPWTKAVEKGFDWVVGNPPWYGVAADAVGLDEPASRWMRENEEAHPVVQRQVAEAFTWRAQCAAGPTTGVALLLPAMSLFCEQADFRKRFFDTVDVSRIANFANLRRVLFASRAEAAAAAFFFTVRKPVPRSELLVYSPLVANQEANRPPGEGSRRTTWSIVVNRSEVQPVDRTEISSGATVPWKVAMWGTHRDARLLKKAAKAPTLRAFAEEHALAISQGLELRDSSTADDSVEALPQLAGAWTFDSKPLRLSGRLHDLPPFAKRRISPDLAFARKRGQIALPLRVSEPPHIIVRADRTSAIFSDELVVVPPRDIGIAGTKRDATLLRAMALFLSSDFATYHQFFDSPQEGIRNGRSTLASLFRLPIPLSSLDRTELAAWADLHRRIVRHERSRTDEVLSAQGVDTAMLALERELNTRVFDLVALSDAERALVSDFVHVRRSLTDGRVGSAAVSAPSHADVGAYLDVLASELDAFLDPSLKRRHRVVAVTEAHTGMVEIRLVARRDATTKHLNADSDVGRELRAVRTKLERAHSQWLYFDRNLFLYDDESAFILKPMQRIWWTRSQALVDADTLIAETIGAARTA